MTEEGRREAERLAEEYCDRPRCAQLNRNMKEWHRRKAAYIEAYTTACERNKNEIKRLEQTISDCITTKQNITAGYKQIIEQTTHSLEAERARSAKLIERVDAFLSCWSKSSETPITLQRMREALNEYKAGK